MPKITVIVVGKRHHVRFFPHPNQADRSGNCPAGTVIDRDVTNPAEFGEFKMLLMEVPLTQMDMIRFLFAISRRTAWDLAPCTLQCGMSRVTLG
jgi:Piwi domain